MGFSENLKEIRNKRNITQEQLAEILAVSRQTISKWESGGGYPETEKILMIAKELNVSLDYLFKDLNYKEIESPSLLLEEFYFTKDKQDRLSNRALDLFKLLNNI